AWRDAAEEAARRGPVVYVLKSASLLDYLALDHFTRKLDLPPIAFVNELPPHDGADPVRLTRVVERGDAAALFLKRRTTPGASRRARHEEGTLLDALLALQEAIDRPIILLPTLFVWTRAPERRGFSLVDTL